MPDWTCPTCASDVDEQFETCWNCGTSVNGTADPSFVREVDLTAFKKNKLILLAIAGLALLVSIASLILTLSQTM